jgi:hypothetical protein
MWSPSIGSARTPAMLAAPARGVVPPPASLTGYPAATTDGLDEGDDRVVAVWDPARRADSLRVPPADCDAVARGPHGTAARAVLRVRRSRTGEDIAERPRGAHAGQSPLGVASRRIPVTS